MRGFENYGSYLACDDDEPAFNEPPEDCASCDNTGFFRGLDEVCEECEWYWYKHGDERAL